MIRSEFIKVVGDSVAVNVPDDIATSVAESVETRLRSIIKVCACFRFLTEVVVAFGVSLSFFLYIHRMR